MAIRETRGAAAAAGENERGRRPVPRSAWGQRAACLVLPGTTSWNGKARCATMVTMRTAGPSCRTDKYSLQGVDGVDVAAVASSSSSHVAKEEVS